MTAFPLPHVTMVGLGYIGLPTAAVIAQSGCTVHGIDVQSHVVDTINRGEIHIEEHDLDVLVRDMVSCGRLAASLEPTQSDVFLIAVPTPFVGDHVPDITFVLESAKKIAPVLKPGNIVILESTSPIGTTEKMAKLLADERPDLKIAGVNNSEAHDIHVAYCPERVLPGKIIAELVANDRSIGGITPACAKKAREFYQIFVKGECIETTAATAEMVKLVENASRDVNIAFANELSLIADRMGLNIWDVVSLANRHPRVNILQPGPGVGGHCIAVDPWFLVDSAPNVTPLIRTAREVNDGKCDYVAGRVDKMVAARPDSKIACLGLAFKANIDDFRESPALKIAESLATKYGDRVQIVEPFADTLPGKLDGSGAALVSLQSALQDCDIMLLLVDHEAFASVTAKQISGKQVYDTRGQWLEILR
ncbi:MAG: UDP-N-acetyl-D-mannosamine dehydrogenase [Sphingorhabdus sp.]